MFGVYIWKVIEYTHISNYRLLRALVTVVVAMVPPPEELLRLHKDDSKALVEKIQAVVVLKKGTTNCKPPASKYTSALTFNV